MLRRLQLLLLLLQVMRTGYLLLLLLLLPYDPRAVLQKHLTKFPEDEVTNRRAMTSAHENLKHWAGAINRHMALLSEAPIC
jgi:hypothetical protein